VWIKKISILFKIWHRRFGHYNINNIKDILPKKLIIIAIVKYTIKQKLKNFPFHPNDKKKANEPLELIHMDIVYSNWLFFIW